MNSTAIVFSPKFFQHDPGRSHPETAKRLRSIISELNNGQLSKSKRWQYVEPQEACIRDVTQIHSIEYVKSVQKLCRLGGGILDSGDTVVSRESFATALNAAGGAIQAVDLVMKKQFQNAFAAVRPPGHHAEKSAARGFCIFNNIAVAAKRLLRNYKLKRVLILDIDAHHGNGTQQAFYETDRLLYISLHEDPREFPKSGFIDETGSRKGVGYTVNIPLPFETADEVYLSAIREIVLPIMRQYKPQFILVSSGFDGHFSDPVGRLSLSAFCYEEIYRLTLDLAKQLCNGRFFSVLEGGYSRKFLGRMAASAIAQMSGSPYRLTDVIPLSAKHVKIQGQRIIELVKKVQKDFWSVG